MARIVAIDDDILFLEVMRTALGKQEGHTVFTADNPSIGLTLVENIHPDLIILDVCFPTCFAPDFLKIMHSNPALADIPIVIITGGSSMLVQADELQSQNVREIATKPIDLDSLLALVKRHLPEQPC